MQVVLVYLEWFRRNSLLKCVSQPKIAKKFTKTPYFWGSWSFRVVDVGTTGKLVSNACYDKPQVCSVCNRSREPIVVKLRFVSGGTPLLCPRSRGISSPDGTKLSHYKLETLSYHTVKTRSLSHLGLIRYRVVTPGRTDGRTDRIPIANRRSQQYLPPPVQLSRVKILKISSITWHRVEKII